MLVNTHKVALAATALSLTFASGAMFNAAAYAHPLEDSRQTLELSQLSAGLTHNFNGHELSIGNGTADTAAATPVLKNTLVAARTKQTAR